MKSHRKSIAARADGASVAGAKLPGNKEIESTFIALSLLSLAPVVGTARITLVAAPRGLLILWLHGRGRERPAALAA